MSHLMGTWRERERERERERGRDEGEGREGVDTVIEHLSWLVDCFQSGKVRWNQTRPLCSVMIIPADAEDLTVVY